MQDNNFGSKLRKNVFYAYTAQAISMLISVVFTLLLPKYLGVAGYGYWQLMIMYVNYLGFFYLGLNDGYYLRHGGQDYEKLDFRKLKSQIALFLIIHIVISLTIILLASVFVTDLNIRFVIILVSIYLPAFNMNGFLGQVFQATNNIKVYSKSVILDKVIMLLFIIILIFLSNYDYRSYITSYIISGVLVLIYIIYKAKNVFKSDLLPIKETVVESKENIKIGFTLMISGILSMLIIGSSKQIIEWKWGIETFSIVSLAISLMNLILVFVNKSGMVLFPSLRTLDNSSLKKWYINVRELLNTFLPLALLVYLPISYFINYWLPQYEGTIYYLGLLLPTIIFEIKTSVLGTTFLKVLNKQKILLLINVSSFLFSILFSIIGAYIIGSIEFVLVAIVIALGFRMTASEAYIDRHLGIKFNIDNVLLIIVSFLFVVSNVSLDILISFILILVVSVINILFKSNKIKNAYIELKNINKLYTKKSERRDENV